MSELKVRSEMNQEATWNLSDMIKNLDEWNSYYSDIESNIEELAAYQGKLMSSSTTLYEALSKMDDFYVKLYRVVIYSHMNLHQDTNASDSQSLVQKISALEVKASTALAYVGPEIMAADEAILKQFLEENDDLKLYSHYFDNMLRQKEHILPKEQEELLALAGDFESTPQNIFSMFMNADLVLPEVIDDDHNPIRLTQGNLLKLLKSGDVEVRKTAFEAMASKLEENKNTLTSIYLSSLKKDLFQTRARKFDSCRMANLHGKNIDPSVYDNLIDAVHENLHLLHRYVSLRKKMLGLDEIHMYDLYTPMVKDMDEEIPFEEAKKIVKEGLVPLGEEYLGLLENGFTNRWIDVYENKGKRSGAYSWGTYGVHPYVLLNYQDTLNNTFTLAHEMGHALHTYYSNDTQPFVYHSYPIFLAEVASTVNEDLLMNHMLKVTTDKEKRKYLINHYMEKFRTTLYRQTLFAEFEKKSHELVEQGEAVTSDVLNQIHWDLNKKYYGDDIVVDESIKTEWSRIPHFYTPFYVYQYATGFSSAVAISQRILDEGETAVNDYKTFLKSGCSKYPLETLKITGVDMTTAEPVKQALKVFENLLDEMEKLV